MVDKADIRGLQAARDAREYARGSRIGAALDNLAEQGRKFGYPSCCIDFFLDRWFYGLVMKKMIIMPETWPLAGSGFVPCPMCAATYTDEELFDKIQAARDPALPPFPEEPEEEDDVPVAEAGEDASCSDSEPDPSD